MLNKSKLVTIISLLLLLVGCTEKAEPPMHPTEWLEGDAEYSHMAKIAETGIDGCRACHGDPNDANDYYGGNSGVSCYECHESGQSGHPVAREWMYEGSENFHGQAYIERGMDDCFRCHDKTDGNDCQICHTDWLIALTTQVN